MNHFERVESLFAQFASGDADVLPVLEDAVRELPLGADKARWFVVTRKAWTRHGVHHPEEVVRGAFAVVTPGKSVRLFGVAYGEPYDRTFEIGSIVAYDSWNMVYTGPIKAIGPRGTVTVLKEGSSRACRLDLEHFSSRNRTLDLAAIEARNADVMMNL